MGAAALAHVSLEELQLLGKQQQTQQVPRNSSSSSSRRVRQQVALAEEQSAEATAAGGEGSGRDGGMHSVQQQQEKDQQQQRKGMEVDEVDPDVFEGAADRQDDMLVGMALRRRARHGRRFTVGDQQQQPEAG